MKIGLPRLRRYEIAQPSMTPHLQPGDYVVAVRTTAPRRGDIIITTHPDQPSLELVKRVVALPHERLEIADDTLIVDGAPQEEPWASGATTPDGTWQLGDEIFVLGDQRQRSIDDSRTLGPIPMNRPLWRVWFRYWPRGRIGVLR